MALAIWIAAGVDRVFGYLASWPFLLTFLGLFAVALLAGIVRLVRRASLADICPSPILDAWFLARFVFIPATFVLALLWLVAWAIRLGVAWTLGEATLLTLMHGMLFILLTSILADLSAALKGPRRDAPSDS